MKQRNIDPLLPIRHAQQDLFICDLFDTWKDDMGSMEHPVFSLKTQKDMRIKKYEHNGNTVEIKPGSDGLATIHDKDVLLYLASHIMHEINERQKKGTKTGKNEIEAPAKTVRFTAYDLLVLTNRDTGGKGYRDLKKALDRITGTRIKTNIETNGVRQIENFGILDKYGIVERDPKNGRMISVQVTLSDWFYNALLGREVLTISEDYFRLRKPLERRIYELCRKHCGNQRKWEIYLEKLKKKTGSSAPLYEFRRMIKKIVETDHMPEYSLGFDDYDRDKLLVKPRNPERELIEHGGVMLKTQTLENAGKILRPYGLDKYAVQDEWREWMNGKEPPKNADGAFIGFCKMKIAGI